MRDLVSEWSSPEGLADTTRWVDEVLSARGERRLSPLDPVRVRFWSAVHRLETDRGRRWVKLGNPGQAFEGALLAQLGAVVPDEVVTPLAVDRAEGRWLLPDGGPTLRDAGAESPADRAALLTQVAGLQQRVAGERDRLSAVPALPLADTTAYVAALVDRLASLADDDPQAVDRADVARWRAGLPGLDAAVGRLAALGLPDTLQPGDVHAGNACAPQHPGGPARLIDLGDAVWGHPLGVLHLPLRQAVGARLAAPLPDTPLVRGLADAYLDRWPRTRSTDRRALIDDADRVGAAHRLVSWERLLGPVDPAAVPPPLPRLADWVEQACRTWEPAG